MCSNHAVVGLTIVANLSFVSFASADGACCARSSPYSADYDLCWTAKDAAHCQFSASLPTIFQEGADCCGATCLDVFTGACCYDYGACVQATSASCYGAFEGYGTACDADTATFGYADLCPSSLTFCSPCGDIACDDDNECTDDFCIGSSCKHEANKIPCNDGDACTTLDVCFQGACQGTQFFGLAEWSDFAASLTGPDQPIGPSCGCSDLNVNEHVDLMDVSEFMNVFAGDW